MTFPYQASYFDGNQNLAIFVNLLIYFVIILFVPTFFVFIISLFKPRIKRFSNFYLYAFSSAMFIMIGTVGLIHEGFEGADHFLDHAEFSDVGRSFTMLGIVAGGGIIGLAIAILSRFVFIRYFGEVHDIHASHDHSDLMINVSDVDSKNIKAAWLVLFLLLAHRTIDGFVLGGTTGRLSVHPDEINIGFVITFNLHILVESLIIYYRQVQYGQKRWKAMLYNFYTTIFIIPIMIAGAYLNDSLNKLGWFLPIVNVAGGAIITFVGVTELVPEFIHNRTAAAKQWYKILAVFSAGIIFSLIVLSFHSHGEEEHAEGAAHVEETAKYYRQVLSNISLVWK